MNKLRVCWSILVYSVTDLAYLRNELAKVHTGKLKIPLRFHVVYNRVCVVAVGEE